MTEVNKSQFPDFSAILIILPRAMARNPEEPGRREKAKHDLWILWALFLIFMEKIHINKTKIVLLQRSSLSVFGDIYAFLLKNVPMRG